jgi:hypothetical protein
MVVKSTVTAQTLRKFNVRIKEKAAKKPYLHPMLKGSQRVFSLCRALGGRLETPLNPPSWS